MLVNGYYFLYVELEEWLVNLLGFESVFLVGSGFLGNLVLIDIFLVKNVFLFMDVYYYVSGIFSIKIKFN